MASKDQKDLLKITLRDSYEECRKYWKIICRLERTLNKYKRAHEKWKSIYEEADKKLALIDGRTNKVTIKKPSTTEEVPSLTLEQIESIKKKLSLLLDPNDSEDD